MTGKRSDYFFQVAEQSLKLNRDNVNMLFHYFYYAVEVGDGKRSEFALRRLKALKTQYGLGVHTPGSKKMYDLLRFAETQLSPGKPVARKVLPNVNMFIPH